MNTRLFFEHLSNLLSRPHEAWVAISKEYHESPLALIKVYFSVFFILLPVVFTLREVILLNGFIAILLRGLIMPAIILCVYLFVLYLLAIIIEEVAAHLGYRSAPMQGAKIAYFSGLPAVSLTVLMPLPLLGPLAMLTGIIYQGVLLYRGGIQLYRFDEERRYLWFLSCLLGMALLAAVFAAVFLALILAYRAF